MSPLYRGKLFVTEEAIEQFWPDQVGKEFIRQVEMQDGIVQLTWGSLTAMESRTQIPLDSILSKIGIDLPDPITAGADPEHGAFYLVFCSSKRTNELRERLPNGDVYKFGALMSTGFERAESQQMSS